MVEKGKQYKTKSGREVRIYDIVDGCEYCVFGAIQFEDTWVIHQWNINGGSGNAEGSPNDLVEVKSIGKSSRTSSSACVKVIIDCEHGEWL